MPSEGFKQDEQAVVGWINKYFLSMLHGMEAVHALGVVHRDMKPENVLIDEGIPKISDFGLGQDTVYWSHAGDSRLYLFHNGFLEQISRDQTFIQDLVEDGTISREEAERHPLRNVLEQCLGYGGLEAESGSFKFVTGDRLLLCSDGLIRHLSDDLIKAVLEEGTTARRAVDKLIDQALKAGGEDNVTVVVMDL